MTVRWIIMLLASIALGSPAAITASSPDPFAAPGTAIELGRTYEFESAVLGDSRRINILLPDGYDDPKSADLHYAVLYLLDGGAGWQDFTHIASMVHQGGLWGANAPMIVVGIESKDRRAEFTRPTSNTSEMRDFPTNGNAEAFHRFLVQELKPTVTRRFRTSGEDGLIGESLAGLFVVDEALRHGASFRHYIAVSPSLWWDDERLARDAANLLSSAPQAERSLWLSIADEGGTMQDGMDRIIAALRSQPSKNVRWTFLPYPTEKHSTTYHLAATRAVRETFPAPHSGK